MSLTGSLTLQLDMTRKLIQTMDRVLSGVERTNNNTSDQSNIINNMNESLSKQQDFLDKSANTLNDSVDELDKALQKNEEASSQNKFMNSLTEYRKHMQNSSAKRYFFLDPMKKLKSNIGSAFVNLIDKVKNTKLGIKVLRKYASLKGQFEDFSKAIEDANGTLERTALILKAIKEVIITSIKGIASFGLGFITKIIGSLISGVINVIKSATSIVLKFLKLTLTLPFQIAQIGAQIGGKIRKEIVETFYQAREDAKKTFDLTSSIGEGVKKLTSITIGSLKSFEYTNSNLTRLFGYGSQGAAQMMKFTLDNVAAMGHFSEIFGNSLMSNADSVEFLARAQKAMNMSTEDISYMALTAASNGESIYNTIDRTRAALQTISEQSGVDFKRLSTNFFKLRKDIVEFGHLSDIELSKTVSRITQLGVKTEDVTNVFKQFSTFESAAQSAAQLYQTFGMNIDAFTLISERDPAKIIEMFRQGMYETGRSFEDLNRHEKSLMSQFTGLSAESLKSAMNFRNMNLSYAELKEKMKAEDTTEKQIKTIDGLKSSITQLQKTLQFKSPFEAFFSGLTKSMAYNEEMYGELMGLSNIYESIHNFALSIDKKDLNNIMAPIVDVITVMKDIFSSDGFKKTLKKTLKAVSKVTLAITKSVFSPDYVKTVDKTIDAFGFLTQKKLKNSNVFISKQIKTALSSKQKGKHLAAAFKAAKIDTRKLTKMSTKELLGAIKKASYAAKNDVKQQAAIADLASQLFKLNADFDDDIRNKVIKKNDPVAAVDEFVNDLIAGFSENADLGQRFIKISGKLMGNIIKGAGAGGLAVLKNIDASLDKVQKTTTEEVLKKSKKITTLDEFDWESLRYSYNSEFEKFMDNKQAILTMAHFLKDTFGGLAKEIANILTDMLVGVYNNILLGDSVVGQYFVLANTFGFLDAAGGTTQESTLQDELNKLGSLKDKKDSRKNRFIGFGKNLAGNRTFENFSHIKRLIRFANKNSAAAQVIAHQAIYYTLLNNYKELSKKDKQDSISQYAFNQYAESVSIEKSPKGIPLFIERGISPLKHLNLALNMIKKIKERQKFKFGSMTNELNPSGSFSKSLNEDASADDVMKNYKNIANIKDGDFNNISAKNIRIVAGNTTYIPSEEDKGEFIVWKKGGAIYNMFEEMNSRISSKERNVKTEPQKVTIESNNNKATKKQIKSIMSKVMILGEVLSKRKIKVNHKIKSDSEEISNIIVNN